MYNTYQLLPSVYSTGYHRRVYRLAAPFGEELDGWMIVQVPSRRKKKWLLLSASLSLSPPPLSQRQNCLTILSGSTDVCLAAA